jgi:hypothetical protein
MAFVPFIAGGLALSGLTTGATIAMDFATSGPLSDPAPPTQYYYQSSDPRVVNAFYNNQNQFKDLGPNINWFGNIKNSSVPGFADTSGSSRD